MVSSNYKRRLSTKIIVLSIIILILLAEVVFLAFNQIKVKSPAFTKESEKIHEFVSFENSTMTGLYIPAVNEEGNGSYTILAVEAMPGSGRVLVDIDSLLFWSDTQQSIRIARRVAENITGKNLGNYDIVYSIYANASSVGGPSAGSAIAIATIAALENKKINKSVMITGTINHDGSIGPVGNIIEKAKAAKELDALLFLVPLLQSRDVVYDITKNCEKFGLSEVCTVEQIPRKINIGDEVGIQIKEVENIKEAMKYMLEQ